MNAWTCDGPSPSEYMDIPNECGHCGHYIETDERHDTNELGPGIWLGDQPYHLECEVFDREQILWRQLSSQIDIALDGDPNTRYRHRARVQDLLWQINTLEATIKAEGRPIT